MITFLSPAKSLDFTTPAPVKQHSQPAFLTDTEALVSELRKASPQRLAKLMKISDKLATLNVERYRAFTTPFTVDNAKQAIHAFQGDVYQGIDLQAWKTNDYRYAQQRLFILSGLYGLLRPLDLMQPYRLEMGTALKNPRGKDLYAFWDGRVTEALRQAAVEAKAKFVVNLASQEYAKVVQCDDLQLPVLTPVFKDEKGGVYKVISFFAKKARGMMADFLVRERVKRPGDVRRFASGGYRFDPASSTETTLTFLRAEPANR